MATQVGPSRLPLLRLRCSTADLIAAVLAREPAWGLSAPVRERIEGDEAVFHYRLQPHSFLVEVRFRRQDEQWVERDFTIVPGAVVALRLVIDDLSPDVVTRRLGLQPTRAWAKGEAAPSSRRVRQEGLWVREVQNEACLWPEEQVGELLALLRGRPGWREVAADPGVTWAGITVQYRGCREQMGALSLDRSMLEDLVALSLQLDVKILAD